MRHLDPVQLKDYLARIDSQPLLLDVREPWEFAIAHIEGSQLVPMREMLSQVHRLDPDRETVVICHHGVRSFQVAHYLERSGFTQVINLSGGIHAWARLVDPSMAQY